MDPRDVPGENSDTPVELEPEPAPMPRWIPVLVASILVGMAALAVYTGMRYRRSPLERPDGKVEAAVRNDGVRRDVGSPGEPVPGGSRVLPGESGENVPSPSGQPFPQQSRVALRGGADGVQPTYRTSARRGVQIVVEPAGAMLHVNEQPIGPASQYSSEDEIYEFPEEGNFTFRLTAPGRQDVIYMITADPSAPDEIARIEIEMEPVKRK